MRMAANEDVMQVTNIAPITSQQVANTTSAVLFGAIGLPPANIVETDQYHPCKYELISTFSSRHVGVPALRRLRSKACQMQAPMCPNHAMTSKSLTTKAIEFKLCCRPTNPRAWIQLDIAALTLAKTPARSLATIRAILVTLKNRNTLKTWREPRSELTMEAARSMHSISAAMKSTPNPPLRYRLAMLFQLRTTLPSSTYPVQKFRPRSSNQNEAIIQARTSGSPWRWTSHAITYGTVTTSLKSTINLKPSKVRQTDDAG
mmetsp:Transcript_2212/g.5637  ORF Transcript_2212/g.5637 Transcript_2212/m.5637 type:complete len:260 (+) Transcript_2212:1834-2613(+)